jgi:hypothetical protein
MTLVGGLSEEAYRDEGVAHALEMRRAVFDKNYCRFFILFRKTPRYGIHIVALLLDRVRVDALRRMVKA